MLSAEEWMLLNYGVRGLLRVPWTARRSNQSLLNEISPEYSLEGLMLKLKLQYFGHMMQRTDSLEKTLMLRKIEGRRRRGWQRIRRLDGITTQWILIWVNSRSWWWTGRPGVQQSMGSQSGTQLSWLNWLRSCRSQCWVASDQITNKERVQLRPSVDNWIKALSSKAQFSPWPVPVIKKLTQASQPHPSEDRQKKQEEGQSDSS